MRIRHALVAVTTTLAVAGLATAGPAAASPQPTTLTIDAAETARTGEPHPVTVTLTDARGGPLAGQPVTVSERLRMFDYEGASVVAEVRTNHAGSAELTYLPNVAGAGRLTAEFPGSEEMSPARDALELEVEEGIGVASPVLPQPPEPLLPRGVTAVWFLPLLLAVWLAIATAVYNALRIPVEREPATAPDRAQGP